MQQVETPVFTEEEKEQIRADIGYPEQWKPTTKEEVDAIGLREKTIEFEMGEAKKQWKVIETRCKRALEWIKNQYHPAMEGWYLENKPKSGKSIDLPHCRIGQRKAAAGVKMEDREALARHLSDNFNQKELDALGLRITINIESEDKFKTFYAYAMKQMAEGEVFPGLEYIEERENFYVK